MKEKEKMKQGLLYDANYDDELLKEINEDRIAHGKKPLKETKAEELNYDEETGSLKKDLVSKHIKVSKTDRESGCFHKG